MPNMQVTKAVVSAAGTALTLAEPGEPVGERQREQEPEQNLHAQAGYAQFLQQLGEIAIVPLRFGFIPRIRSVRPSHRATSRAHDCLTTRHNTAETRHSSAYRQRRSGASGSGANDPPDTATDVCVALSTAERGLAFPFRRP